jgi:CheY-like chemotaxis protein
LFQSFSQVDASTTRKHGGTGLGLAISKRLAELMGGRIWVESEIDKGSVIQFTIPLKPAAEREEPPIVDGHWEGKRILVVDDNPTNRRILTAQLLKWGIESISGATPLEALEVLRGQRVNAAVFDFEMPAMNGVELARTAKALGIVAKTPMVLASSSGTSGHDVLCDGDNPFDAFLTKPIKTAQLRETLRRLLGGTTALRDRRSSSAIESPSHNSGRCESW